jgi:mRNA interferase RelE/StbE
MKVEFLKKFSHDLNNLNQKSIKLSLIKLIDTLENIEDLNSIPNVKKLRGHKSAYRIRIGDYRLGCFFEYNTVILARFLHRREIYNTFP